MSYSTTSSFTDIFAGNFYKIEKLLFLIFVNFPVRDYFVHSDLVVYR